MTDRIRGVYVAFDTDFRSDDAQPIIDAIKMVRGVLSVEPHVTDARDYDARAKIHRHFQTEIIEALRRLNRGDSE